MGLCQQLNAECQIILEKARILAQGFNQQPDDFGMTYAPTAKSSSVRILLAWTAMMKWFLFQFDVKTAFLNALLDEEVYIKQIPLYLLDHLYWVLLLLKALYGLKQAALGKSTGRGQPAVP